MLSLPSNTVARVTTGLLTMLLIELFVGLLLTAGYSLKTALAAAGATAVLSTEIAIRLLGGGTPGRPQLPGGDW